jgi:hypothetical protein
MSKRRKCKKYRSPKSIGFTCGVDDIIYRIYITFLGHIYSDLTLVWKKSLKVHEKVSISSKNRLNSAYYFDEDS